ncbi:MAG TPA: Ppx/GppA family phosphatase [Alphaproteobacteria bacterium]|nr:Ppx/GppA family phosphatase [Alphaproteobacteria bacterium]
MRSRIAPGRKSAGPAGVIDIGSNSIRLVVYAGDERAPHPIFNEKVLCGLGRGLERSNRLNEEGVSLALANLSRFASLSKAMGVRHLRVVGTAAVRDADNGRDFVDEVRKRTGLKVEVLDGEEEARLSALGVLAGTPGANGLMGDLGGGSLELVQIKRGIIGKHVTLPYGPLRLREITDRRQLLLDVIDHRLEKIDWLDKAKGRDFYAVGGSWRGIARLHMAHVNYPLRVIHHYTLSRAKAEDFLDLIAGLSRESLERIGRVPRKRLEVLPIAALVLHRVLERAKPSRLVFSALGLREGCLFDRLSAAQRRRDPLLVAAEEIAGTSARFAVDGHALFAWMAPLFRKMSPEFDRLRLAACLLADIAWNEHPDYRAEIAFQRVLRMPMVGIDHPGRAFLALAVYTRYAGTAEGEVTGPAWMLLDEDRLRDAYRVGLALRLAFTLSGGTPDVLRRIALQRTEGQLRLRIPSRFSSMAGEAVERRFQALSEALDRKPKIKIGG